MNGSTKRLVRAGLMVMMASGAALASPLSVSAHSTHDVVKYERRQIATLGDGTRLYMETLATKGQHSRELKDIKDIKDWNAYANETTVGVTTSQAAAGYYGIPGWYTAGCRITAYSGLGPIYYYQVTHDFGYNYYLEGVQIYPYIDTEGETNEAWSTWWGWNLLSHSFSSNPVVMSTQWLPNGQHHPYQEYITGNYYMGHGVTSPWGSIIIESHAGWVKPVYGPRGQVTCYQS